MHAAHIDRFAYQDSWVHRLDSRVKALVTFLFTAVVLALPLNDPPILMMALVGPFTLLTVGGTPLRFAAKHLLWAAPLILALALSCIWFDRTTATLTLGPLAWHTTTGWLRGLTVIGKFVVTMTAMIALVSTTRFHHLLAGLQQLRVPQILIVQLSFLYRYLFVLIDTAQCLLRARRSRRLRHLGFQRELATGTALLGSLLTRSLTRAEALHRAMQVRGFSGTWTVTPPPPLNRNDVLFMALSGVYLAGLLLVSMQPIALGGGS
jgi:cobalt/nickel transport system permease protein